MGAFLCGKILEVLLYLVIALGVVVIVFLEVRHCDYFLGQH